MPPQPRIPHLDLPDRRTGNQRQLDRARVDTQLKRLRNKPASRAFQQTLFGTIHDARLRRPGDFDVDKITHGADFLVAVRGEILVRSTDAAAAAAVLTPVGYVSEPVARLNGLVTRFSKPSDSQAHVAALVRQLKLAGVGATVNYVAPLGYIAKGEGGFEPTQVLGAAGPGPAAGTGPVVAIIDTGVAAAARTDGFLANLHLDGADVDPLYQPSQVVHPPFPDRPGSANVPIKDLLDFAAGHGTFVAGIVQQVAPQADIRIFRAVHSDGIGSELDIACTVVDAAKAGAKIINLSLGTETEGGDPPVGMAVAMEILASTAELQDVVVIAAAGNSGSTAKSYPAALPGVTAVASLAADGTPSTWSNHGPWVDCSVVGQGIVAPYVTGHESWAVDKEQPDDFGPSAWAIGTGTSFAAPQVAGAVALAMSTDPTLTAHAALQQVLHPANGRQIADYGMTFIVLSGT